MSASPIIDNDRTSSSTDLIENPLTSISLPSFIAERIWKNTTKLSSSDICKAPGTDSCWVVKNISGTKPYIVEKTSVNRFICDPNCLTYKVSNICPHTVAAAQHCDSLQHYLDWYRKNHCEPNISSLAQSGIQTGGSKPKKPKGTSKGMGKKLSCFVEEAKEDDWSERPCTTTANLKNITLSSTEGSSCVLSIQSSPSVTQHTLESSIPCTPYFVPSLPIHPHLSHLPLYTSPLTPTSRSQ
jgi:hypothetical protein